jgi:hypothetical protein
MKKLMMIFFAVGTCNIAFAAYVDNFKIKLHKIAVSSDDECSNMKVVVDHGSVGKEVDLINLPEFGRAQLSSGEYKCIAMEVDPDFKFTPGSDNVYTLGQNGIHGTCANGVESTVTLANNYIPIIEDYSYTNSCSGQECLLNGAVTGKVVLWFQTKSTAGTCPNGSTQMFANTASLGDLCGGIKVDNPLSVSSQGAGKFIVKFDDSSRAIDNTTPGECNLLDILFDFD